MSESKSTFNMDKIKSMLRKGLERVGQTDFGPPQEDRKPAFNTVWTDAREQHTALTGMPDPSLAREVHIGHPTGLPGKNTISVPLETGGEQEFRGYICGYDEQSTWHREIYRMLPMAMSIGQLTQRTKRAILGRVVLRDLESLTHFFLVIIRSPHCAQYVKALHCRVDLGNHTSPTRLNRDMVLVSSLSHHLHRCPISVELLRATRDHIVAELSDKPYDSDLDARFRQAMFLSLLGHLQNLETLRFTLHGHANETPSWLRSAIQRHIPIRFAEAEPCRYPCRSLRKLIFSPADTYRPASLWHPCCLWPLMDLRNVEVLEVEHDPTIWKQGRDTVNENGSSDGQAEHTCRALAHLHTLRLNHLPPLPRTLRQLFSSFRMLHALSICGSVISPPTRGGPDEPQSAAGCNDDSTETINLNTLLSLSPIATSLRYLSIHTDTPTSASISAVAAVPQRHDATRNEIAAVSGPTGLPASRGSSNNARRDPQQHMDCDEADVLLSSRPSLARLELVEERQCVATGGRAEACERGEYTPG
ncbi:hypothetical protein VTK26DRAFT_2837 [Humicola hyalothermophila]